MPETLADLIAERKGVLSYGDLAQASGVTSSTWHRWAGGEFPTGADNVKAIAVTLQVPERRVWLAVGATQGLNVATPSETALSLALSGLPLDTLTPKQVDLLAGMAGELVAAQARQKDEKGATVSNIRPTRAATSRAARTTTGSEGRRTKKTT